MTPKERWRLTDEFVEKLRTMKVRINDVMYRAVPDDRDFKVGDLVLDRGDGSHGYIDMFHGNKMCALRDDTLPGLGVVEGGIPLDQIIKLIEWKE